MEQKNTPNKDDNLSRRDFLRTIPLTLAIGTLAANIFPTATFGQTPKKGAQQSAKKISDISKVSTKEDCLDYLKHTLDPAITREFAGLKESKGWSYNTKEGVYRADIDAAFNDKKLPAFQQLQKLVDKGLVRVDVGFINNLNSLTFCIDIRILDMPEPNSGSYHSLSIGNN